MVNIMYMTQMSLDISEVSIETLLITYTEYCTRQRLRPKISILYCSSNLTVPHVQPHFTVCKLRVILQAETQTDLWYNVLRQETQSAYM